jgi:hypothetical protein
MPLTLNKPLSIAASKELDLESLLSYQHPDLLKRFQKDFDATPEVADAVFADLMRFLYLGHRNLTLIQQGLETDYVVAIYPPLLAIDDMWHTFILFTRDYAEFCQNHFGYFIHHQPNTDDALVLDAGKQLGKLLSLIYDELGEETFMRWFKAYC